MNDKYNELENLIGYSFKDKSLLEIAFTHKSYTNENIIKKHESYERFEYLGDAILEFLVSRYLFETYPDMPEGELTRLRASIVCEFTLSKLSRDLKLGSYGYFSKGEKNTGGPNRDSILCDMFESLLFISTKISLPDLKSTEQTLLLRSGASIIYAPFLKCLSDVQMQNIS